MSSKLPPMPVGMPPGHSFWNDWYEKIRQIINNIQSTFTWANIVDKPTTISGFGITDAYTKTEVDVIASNKENVLGSGTTSQFLRGDKVWASPTKSDVGLSNVDNTSDANKPVSTATQNALNLKAPIDSPTFTGTVSLANGIVNSTATIGFTSLGVASQLPNTQGFSGLLRFRDRTLGGAAVFIVDPNSGIQLLGINQIMGLSVAYNAGSSYILEATLTLGTVPRTLEWSIFGGV